MLDFTKINISDRKLGKHYFSMLAELNKYGFQCSASSPSGLNWSTASSTRPSISGSRGWGRAFATITVCIKFYQNRAGFVDDVAKIFWCFFPFTVTVPTVVHLQNVNTTFHKVMWRHCSGEVEKIPLLYGIFTEDNAHQILSKLAMFCERYNRKHFGVFFQFTMYIHKS